MRALLVSPHLDDAVFGCGEWLAAHPGTCVVTVLAGTPPDAGRLTDWDRQCGFDGAGQAMAARLAEDREALQAVGAHPSWLPFLDSQYEASPRIDEVAQALAGLLHELPAEAPVLVPLGLFHSDHDLVHQACLQALRAVGRAEALGYEEALYRAMPGLVQARLATLQQAGIQATPLLQPPAGEAAAKARAIAAYPSQARAFGPDGLADTRHPERFWRLQLG
ncbi:PIG-L family deacetylase [Aquincola tertiaricarbonis]|uniref:PIG-L family deacetylase n=1 Tax=Aquincola tertiaricarbonis TaxID=391953 RepID=UPI000614B2B7|nr:PIG-L family deacetylase [Aquincola tertiaricarbonis]